jgi:hypothetical protein
MQMSVNRKVRNETRKLKERVEHDIDRNVSVEAMLERCHNQFLNRRRSSFLIIISRQAQQVRKKVENFVWHHHFSHSITRNNWIWVEPFRWEPSRRVNLSMTTQLNTNTILKKFKWINCVHNCYATSAVSRLDHSFDMILKFIWVHMHCYFVIYFNASIASLTFDGSFNSNLIIKIHWLYWNLFQQLYQKYISNWDQF